MSTREEIEHYIRKGQKIMAIKVYRSITGKGLRESKDAVEEFMRDGRWSDMPLPKPKPEVVPKAPASPNPGNLEAVVAYIEQKKKIWAIKELRQISGLGLKEAKEAVEMYMQQKCWPSSIAPQAPQPTRTTMATGPLHEAEELARIGRKIQSIKALRSVVGLSLKDSKAAVEHFMERGVWPQSVRNGLSGASAVVKKPQPTQPTALTGSLQEAEELAKLGQKLQSIKVLRRVVPLSLKNSKAAVEHFMERGVWPQSVRNGLSGANAAAPPAGGASSGSRGLQTDSGVCAPTPSNAKPPPPVAKTHPGRTRTAEPAVRLGPEAAAAKSVLEANIQPNTVDHLYAVKRDFTPGYLALVGERAYFVTKRFGSWEVDGEYSKSAGFEAEVRTSFSRIELRLRIGFLPHTFTELDEATARKIARVLTGDSG